MTSPLARPDIFPKLTVECSGCGSLTDTSGRWAEVAMKLAHRGAVHLFVRCAQCGAVAYTPELDLMTGEMEFFQILQPPGLARQLERVTYDLGGWKQMVEGGVDSPTTVFVDPSGHKIDIAPMSDLTNGICAPPGVLPIPDVRQAIRAVDIAFPA